MRKEEICGIEWDVLEWGDVLHASIKNQRNDSAKFVYDAYMGIYKTIKQFLDPVLSSLQASGFVMVYNTYKKILEKIEETIHSVKFSLTEVKDGDDVRPEHVNELYEPFPQLSAAIMMAVNLVQGMTFGHYKEYLSGLDDAAKCLGSYQQVRVKHLDLIQSEEWNAILDMVRACCVKLKIIKEEPEDVRNLALMAIKFHDIISEVPNDIAQLMAKCIESGEDCNKAIEELKKWATSILPDNAISTAKLATGFTYAEYITTILPRVKAVAGLMAGVLNAKSIGTAAHGLKPDKIVSKVSEAVVNNLVSMILTYVKLENEVLYQGEYMNHKFETYVGAFCLGTVYIGPPAGSNQKYVVQQVPCFEAIRIVRSSVRSDIASELQEYFNEICNANRIYVVYTVGTEVEPNALFPTAIITVSRTSVGSAQAIYVKAFAWTIMGYNVFNLCVTYPNGKQYCFTVEPFNWGLNIAYMVVATDGTVVLGGFYNKYPFLVG